LLPHNQAGWPDCPDQLKVIAVPFPPPCASVEDLAANVAVAALPVHEPELPVVFWFSVGNVQLVKVPEVGVPKFGVTSVGDVPRTFAPEPVEVVTPVPPLETPNVPVIPVANGSPVHEVSTPCRRCT
jgi:hypothetical protein